MSKIASTKSFTAAEDAIPYKMEIASDHIIKISPKISKKQLKANPGKAAVVDAYVFDEAKARHLMSIEVKVDPASEKFSLFDTIMDWIGKR